jgi:hypothetical protein
MLYFYFLSMQRPEVLTSFPESKKKPVPKGLMLHIIKIYWKKYPDSLGPSKKPVPKRSQNHPSMQRLEALTDRL